MNKTYTKWLTIHNKHITDRLKLLSENEIETLFGEPLSFGTAGLRGKMDIGSSRLNDVNICKLANAVLLFLKKKKQNKVVIGFDTRNNSKQFAKVFAKVLATGGVDVIISRNYIPTPVLIHSIGATGSNLGIMITASHNSKEYNGVKISGSDGIQISGEVEKEINKNYQKLNEVELYNKYLKFANKKINKIKFLSSTIVKSFLGNFYKNKINSSLNIIYTPLNGTAYNFVIKALKGTGFKNVVTPFSQRFANGEFKTCPSPNPEYEKTFEVALKCTEDFDADVIVATDPDGDRLGAMIKSTKGYKLLTGNEIGFLLLNYFYENKASYDKNLFAISTVVSSPMFYDMCSKYGIKYEKTLTGFKNIGSAKKQLEDKLGKDGFLLAYEESCGYIVKDAFYDKDGIFALLKFCELASFLKNQGSSIEEYLYGIYDKFNNIYSLNSNIVLSGENALNRMNDMINSLRQNAPKTLLKKKILKIIDYLNDKTGLPASNFIEYQTKDFNFIIRPSGTEPKLKFYIHAKGKNLEESKKLANDVLASIKKEILEI